MVVLSGFVFLSYFLSQVSSSRPGIHSSRLRAASAAPASSPAPGIPRAAAHRRPRGNRTAWSPTSGSRRLHELGHGAALGCPGQRRFWWSSFLGRHSGDFPVSKHPAWLVAQHAARRRVSSAAAECRTAALPAHLRNVSFFSRYSLFDSFVAVSLLRSHCPFHSKDLFSQLFPVNGNKSTFAWERRRLSDARVSAIGD
jgi:hypothetical protein